MSNAFDPFSMAGVALWLKADTGLYKDLAKTQLVASGDPVAVWADQSGQGHDAIQIDPSARPTYLAVDQNVNGAVFFSGYPVWMSHSYPNPPGSSTVLISIKSEDNRGAEYSPVFMSCNDTDNLTRNPVYLRSPGSPNWWSSYLTNSASNIFGAWHVISSTYDESTSQLIQSTDGVAEPPKATVPLPGNQAYRKSIATTLIGPTTAYAPETSVFKISEILIYGRVLSDVERHAVETYLMAKQAPPPDPAPAAAGPPGTPRWLRNRSQPHARRLFRR